MTKHVFVRFAVEPRRGAWVAAACSPTAAAPLATIIAEGYGCPLGPECWRLSLGEIREALLQAQPNTPERTFWITVLKAAVRCASTGKDRIQNFPQHIPAGLFSKG